MRSLAVVGLCSIACVACRPSVPPLDLDGSTSRDAPALDTNTDSGPPPGTCHFDMTNDLFELDTDSRAETNRVATAGGPTSFGVVYSRRDASGGENVFFVEIPSGSGAPTTPQPLTTGTFINTAPTITRTRTGWLIAWRSNRDGNAELYALGSGADGRLASAPTRVTSTPSIDEQTPALASNGTTSALAWAEPGTPTTTVVRALGADGTTSGMPARTSPAGFSMVPTAFTTTDVGYLVGWGDPNGDALIQPLALDGTAMGAPLALTAEHNTDGTLDAVVASGSTGGGAVVYGAIPGGGRHDVHAHLVDRAGALTFAEHVLTIGLDNGEGASIAEIGGGFAVAYRQVGTPPMLRVAFFDSLLNAIGHGDLVPMAATGGPITLRIAADGNLLLTWGDVVGTTSQVRAVRLRCQ